MEWLHKGGKQGFSEEEAALLLGPFGHTYNNRISRLFGQSEQVLPVKQVYDALRHAEMPSFVTPP